MYSSQKLSEVRDRHYDYAYELRATASSGNQVYYELPDNRGKLMINVGPDFRRRIIGIRNHQIVKTGDIILSNCQSRGIAMEFDDILRVLVIKVNPGYCKNLNRTIQELTRDNFVILDNTKSILTLREFCNYALELAKGTVNTDPLVLDAIDLIEENSEDIRVKTIYETLCVSKSTLEQRFSKELTLTPKEYCKIQKMKRFMKNYSLYGNSLSLTQLTFQSGYYDQSHLIKDFRYFTDMNPRKFLNEVNFKMP